VQGSSYLTLRGANTVGISIQDTAGVSLKHNGTEKIATTSSGATVSGNLIVDTIDGTNLQIDFGSL
jgi:hypothetical protein